MMLLAAVLKQAKHHLKKGYFAEKQNTTSNEQASMYSVKLRTKHINNNVLLKAKHHWDKKICMYDAFAAKQSTI